MDTEKLKHSNTKAEIQSQMVWDLPLRVFHWSLVVLFFIAWFSGDNDQWLDIHVFAGYAITALILFRVIWGYTGTYHARFKQFRYSPRQAWDYAIDTLTGTPQRYVGHNPAGSLAVYLLLIGVFLVILSGFFVFGGEEGHGPLAFMASTEIGWWSRNIHNAIATALMTLVFIHIAGVFVESYIHKEKLVLSMLNGRKWVSEKYPQVSPRTGVAVVMLSLLLLYVLSAGIGVIPGKEWFESQFTGKPLAKNDTWQEECSACHLAYHPSLLPARSWKKLFQQQDKHFGEDLMLDKDVITELTDYAVANAAEKGVTEAARKINSSIKLAVAPLRITDTPYWKHKHHGIDEKVFKQSNVNGKAQCDACHSDAKQGWFEDSRMKIPAVPKGDTVNF